MTRDDLFKINAGIVQGLIEGITKYCPKAFILVISNPVNSTVPIAAEVLKKAGVFDPKKLFGVTTLDVVRAETFVASITGESNPGKLNIPVIGGHSGETIVPLFSLAKPSVNIPSDKLDALVNRKWGVDQLESKFSNVKQVCSSVATRLSKQRKVLAQLPCLWLMLGIGTWYALRSIIMTKR